MRIYRLLSVFLALLMASSIIACSDDVSNANDDSFNITEPTGNEGTPPPPIQFILENQLDTHVFIQAAVEPGPGWLAIIFDDEPIHIRWDCGLPCECPDPAEPDAPTACMDCGMAPPFTVELEPGGTTTHTWDGVQYNVSDGCFEKVQRTNEIMEAEFCWGFETTGDEYDDYVHEPTCESVEFELGVDEEVVVTIDENVDPPHPVEPDIDFVLENDSDETIYVQHGTAPAPSWLEVVLDGEPIEIKWDCGLPCPCDETEDCMVCGMPLPWTEEIASGEETRFAWNGVKFAIIDGDNAVCFEEVPLSQESMTARFCYGYETQLSEYDGEYISDPVCEKVDFELGIDGEARLIVE